MLPLMSNADSRPPFIQFDSREMGIDADESEKRGYPVPRVVDVIMITPMGSKDVYEKDWAEWIEDKKRLAQDGRYDRRWIEQFELAYKEWKAGHDMPVNGTPLEGWPLLAKMQAAQCHAARLYSVEDLAAANEDAIQAIGIGGRYYQQLARKWVEQATAGIDVKRITDLEFALKQKNDDIEELRSKLKQLEKAFQEVDNAPPRRGPGRPKKQEIFE